MLRIAIDTNVIVSGILSRKGAPAQILIAWRERRFLLITSSAIIAEVGVVLQYPHIRKKYPLSDDDVDHIISLLEHDAVLVTGEAEVTGSIPDDPKDEMVLACAVDGEADAIVSGDHHLIDLENFRDIPIMTARQFLDQLRRD